jgi:hypothetical protein
LSSSGGGGGIFNVEAVAQISGIFEEDLISLFLV